MTKLRERMIGDMQLRGLADRTIEAYVHAVRGLALHFNTPPDEISEEQVGEYLQHVLPRGFTKVRYYGLFAPACRRRLATARAILDDHQTASTPTTTGAGDDPVAEERPLWRCPYCHHGALRWIRAIHRQRGPP